MSSFLAFNKIKAMVSSVEEIEKAISTSEMLRLSEDRTKVARRADLASMQTRCSDECTIYVVISINMLIQLNNILIVYIDLQEALPTNATHDWVRKIFEPYGVVAYVSLPKYRTSQRIKEFAFVEFEQRSSVLRAMTAFAEFGGALNATADPEKLGSILAFLREQNGDGPTDAEKNVQQKKANSNQKKRKVDGVVNASKSKIEHDSCNSSEPAAKKGRLDTDEVEPTKADAAADEVPAGPDEEEMAQSSEQCESISETNSAGTDAKVMTGDAGVISATDDEDDDGTKGGIKVRRKKTTGKHNPHQHQHQLQHSAKTPDNSCQALRITTKLEWKRLRNKYLNQQREKVKQLKKQWWLSRQQENAIKSDAQPDNNKFNSGHRGQRSAAAAGQEADCSQSPLFAKRCDNHTIAGSDDIDSTGSMADQLPSKESSANNSVKGAETAVKGPLFSFEPGIIVRVTFCEPCVDVKDFKAEMRQHACVRYVDVREGDMSAYVRIDSSDSAGELGTRAAPLRCEVLAGDEESAYWQKIHTDRQQKLSKQLKVKPKRGREKVKAAVAAAAAVLQANHVRFDD